MDPWKHPRTPHLPWSPGRSDDDLGIETLGYLQQDDIVVTEKMDGENTTLYRNGLHARSVQSTDHPSRHWLKAFWAERRWQLPENVRICGENLYAVHSIAYPNLPSYFLAFSAWEGNICLPWQHTQELCQGLGISMVPTLYEGPWDLDEIRRFDDPASWPQLYGPVHEGYVVRSRHGFNLAAFDESVAKYVRPGHVQTNDHWRTQPIVPNGLARRTNE